MNNTNRVVRNKMNISTQIIKMNPVERLHAEMDRVRGIIKIYDELPNSAAAFNSDVMEISIKNAEHAVSNGDEIGMIESFETLKSYNL